MFACFSVAFVNSPRPVPVLTLDSRILVPKSTRTRTMIVNGAPFDATNPEHVAIVVAELAGKVSDVQLSNEHLEHLEQRNAWSGSSNRDTLLNWHTRITARYQLCFISSSSPRTQIQLGPYGCRTDLSGVELINIKVRRYTCIRFASLLCIRFMRPSSGAIVFAVPQTAYAVFGNSEFYIITFNKSDTLPSSKDVLS